MENRIVARWQDWSGTGIEHLVLREGPDQIVAEAAILAAANDQVFAARYRIQCDSSWRVRKAEIGLIGGIVIELASDGAGNWVDGSAASLRELEGAIDIDISATPFTNTLPIRRLQLGAGQSADIVSVYVLLPDLSVTTDRQRYTCFEPSRLYRYESIDSDFTRDVVVDSHGLVVTYPGLFRRVL